MVELIQNIDQSIFDCLNKGKFYGLCRLLKDDKGEVYPATVSDNKKVTPDDRHKIAWYHRYMDSTPEDSETFSFGRHPSILNAQQMRMVVVIAFSEGEKIIDDIVNAMPDSIINAEYKFAEVGNSMTLIRDRQSIWQTEWGEAYDDKYQMRFNMYALEYNLEYIKCTTCVS